MRKRVYFGSRLSTTKPRSRTRTKAGRLRKKRRDAGRKRKPKKGLLSQLFS